MRIKQGGISSVRGWGRSTTDLSAFSNPWRGPLVYLIVENTISPRLVEKM